MQKNRYRRLQQYGSDGAAGHDHHGRAIDQRVYMTTLQPIAAQYREKRDDNSNKAKKVESHNTLIGTKFLLFTLLIMHIVQSASRACLVGVHRP